MLPLIAISLGALALAAALELHQWPPALYAGGLLVVSVVLFGLTF